MARLIDADDAIKYLKKHKKIRMKNNIILAADEDAIIKFINQKCPTVDAEPVRRGHIVWKDRFVGRYKYVEIKCHNCGSIEQAEVEHPIKTKIGYCSECGKRLDDTFMKYCPNCGAKMEEVENE